MTVEEARHAGQNDPQFNHPLGVFAVMKLTDGSHIYGPENASVPKSREEAQARPKVVERWGKSGFDEWQQIYL